MPSPKKSKTKQKLVSRNKNIKIYLIAIIAFALVGVVVLVRSFASTTVLSLDLGSSLSLGAVPGLSSSGTTVVEEPRSDGKKQTVAKIAELKTNTATPGQIKYNTKLNPGIYDFCTNIKPTTAGAEGSVSVKIPAQNLTKGFTFINEQTSTGLGNKTHQLNQLVKVCVPFRVADATADYQLTIEAAKGTWRAQDLIIVLSDQANSRPALVKAAQALINGTAPNTIQYSAKGSVQIIGDKKEVAVVSDSSDGVLDQVVEIKKSKVQMSEQLEAGKKYRACSKIRPSSSTGGLGKDILFELVLGSASSVASVRKTDSYSWSNYCSDYFTAPATTSNAYITGGYSSNQTTIKVSDVWFEPQL